MNIHTHPHLYVYICTLLPRMPVVLRIARPTTPSRAGPTHIELYITCLTQTHIHTHTHTHANPHTNTHTLTQTHIHTHTQIRHHTHTHTHANTHTNTHTLTQTHIHTHTNTSPVSRKHTHTHTHTHMCHIPHRVILYLWGIPTHLSRHTFLSPYTFVSPYALVHLHISTRESDSLRTHLTKVCAGCQKISCMQLKGIVCIFTHPTHLPHTCKR